MSISPSGHVIRHTKRKARESNPHPREGAPRLANRPGKPYPATFRNHAQWTDRELNPDLQTRQPGVFPLDHQPIFIQWTAGESNPDCLGANQASSPWTSGPHLKRSVRESNPVFLLTEEVCCRNTYRPFRNSDPGWSRTITFLVVTQASSPLDHGIMLISDRGGSRTHRHEALDLAAMPICVPGHKWRVRGSHPAVQAYEARLSTGPPAVAGPGIEPGHRPYGSQLGTCRACNLSVTKGRVELPSPSGHDVLSVACLPVPPLGHVQAARAGIEPASPA